MGLATRPRAAALADRIAGAWRGLRAGAEPTPSGSDPDVELRLAAVDARLTHMEDALEDLQDALYRQARREDETRADLQQAHRAQANRQGAQCRRPAPRPMTDGSPSIESLEAEARYARERYALYRAKTYGPRPTSLARLRELERIHQGAEARLERARQAQRAQAADDVSP